MTPKPTLLALLAHPDDEAFGSGGTLAHYATAGVTVALVCATRGEVGQIADPGLATPETLAEVREAELRCAAEALGLNEVIFLGYRDSGMAGTPENQDARAFMNAPVEAVIAQLVGLIRRLQPQVILTFDPTGGYGHPDHIMIHRSTMAAFGAAGDPARYPEQGPAWQPARLFYPVLPRSLFRELYHQVESLGLDTTDFERFAERGEIGWPDEQVDVIRDVSQTVAAKRAALQCHRTQFGPDNPFRKLPEAVIMAAMSREYFVLAHPQPVIGFTLPDLFAGL